MFINLFYCTLILQDKKLKSLIATKKKNTKTKQFDSSFEMKLEWDKIAASMGLPVRTGDECKARYLYLKVAQTGKGPWTEKEDQRIVRLVNTCGKFHYF